MSQTTATPAAATTIVVDVNRNRVTFHVASATGMQIKETAIDQGVRIERDFALREALPSGQLKPIGDDETVQLHKDQTFRAVAPDDHS